MIFKLKQWCEGIIIAIIISVIIEMLIPDTKSKKYVKVIIGVYIMFVSLNPILELLKYEINFDDFLNINTIQTSSQSYDDIKDVYVLGIEEKIKEDIETLGYQVDVKILVDSNYEEINEIHLKINGKQNSNIVEIQKITIGENVNKNGYEDIISLLKNNYLVEKEKIFIKE